MALPNLVIAGVTKAGTTSLFHYLGQHPQIGVADLKEVDHYAPMVHGDEPPPLAEYAAHFAHCVDSPWRLEASPRYFIGGRPLVQRLAKDLERPRVLIAVREPVSRMWSSYTFKRSKDRLPDGMDFAAFVERCRQVADAGSVRDADDAMFRTLASGAYADYLGDWFDVLGDDVRVVFFDDITAAPREQVASICSWLGLPTAPVADIDVAGRNATFQPRSQALRRTAIAVNARLARGHDSPLKRGLRAAYQKVNAGSADLVLSTEDRAAVQAFYAPTLPPLRRLLQARGYDTLPPWLTEDATVDTPPAASG